MNRREFFRSSLAAAVATSLAGNRALAALAPVATDLEAVTGSGARVTLAKSAVQELRDSLRGALLLPGQPGYDEARRVLNASIDKHPALVVQPSGPADVGTAVDFARDHGLLLAVKCGGHSYAGKSTCDGGLQIDLSRFRGVRVDPAARIAYVAGGSLLGELDHEAMSLGLVTTAGTVSHTGVGGLTLGAGFGRLARRYGLALDNVRGVDIVTADGRLLHASAEENPDLFWGVRGGGGNFGVVTTFEFRLHPMQRQVIGGDVVFPLARARELLDFYSTFSLEAPDDLYCDAVLHSPPGGKDGAFIMNVCYSGAAADAERVLAPLRKLGKPLNDSIGPVDYVKLQRSSDSTDPRNRGEYLKSGFINGFPPASRDGPDRRLPAGPRAQHDRVLPALRRCDRARGTRCDGVPAPALAAQHVRGRQLGHRARRRAAHGVRQGLLVEAAAVHRRLLHQRGRERAAAPGGRELPGQHRTARRAQDQVRPGQSVQAQRQREAHGLTAAPQSSAASIRSHSLRSTSRRAWRLSLAGTIAHGACRVSVSAIMSLAAFW